MRPTVRLGSFFGIPVGLHWSAVLIVGLVTIGVASTVLPVAAPGYAGSIHLVVGLVVAGALLASIVAHEFGHALVARGNGVGCRSINLFALGGLAELESEARTPGAAARIALAGPAVSVAIGVVALVVSSLAASVGASPLVTAALSTIGVINLVMAVFNLLPALPLDGGRVLQAALWRAKGDRERATMSAAGVGQFLGWALVAFGAWLFVNGGTGLWTMVIGWFVVSGARAEATRARFQMMARDWPAPQWWQMRPSVQVAATPGRPVSGGPGRPTTGPGAAGRPASGPIIDVTSRPVDDRTERHSRSGSVTRPRS